MKKYGSGWLGVSPPEEARGLKRFMLSIRWFPVGPCGSPRDEGNEEWDASTLCRLRIGSGNETK